MSSSHDRLKWLGIVVSFTIILLLYPIFLDEPFGGGDSSRLKDEETSNRDSLVVLWEDGSNVANVVNADFRLATLGIGLLLFISIFSTLIIHFSNEGGNNDE